MTLGALTEGLVAVLVEATGPVGMGRTPSLGRGEVSVTEGSFASYFDEIACFPLLFGDDRWKIGCLSKDCEDVDGGGLSAGAMRVFLVCKRRYDG